MHVPLGESALAAGGKPHSEEQICFQEPLHGGTVLNPSETQTDSSQSVPQDVFIMKQGGRLVTSKDFGSRSP